MNERSLLREIVFLAEKIYGWTLFHDTDSRMNRRGFPDLFLKHDGQGRLLVIECKVWPRKPDADQLAWLTMFRQHGLSVFVWYPEHLPAIDRILGSPMTHDEAIMLIREIGGRIVYEI